MPNTRAFAVTDAKAPFTPFAFDRRERLQFGREVKESPVWR
jgi:hypothetical protein